MSMSNYKFFEVQCQYNVDEVPIAHWAESIQSHISFHPNLLPNQTHRKIRTIWEPLGNLCLFLNNNYFLIIYETCVQTIGMVHICITNFWRGLCFLASVTIDLYFFLLDF